MFEYTVVAGDQDQAGGLTSLASAITGGSIVDAAGNALTAVAVVNEATNTVAIRALVPITTTTTIVSATTGDNATGSGATNSITGGVPGTTAASARTTDDATLDVQGTLTAALGTNEVVAVYDGDVRLGTAAYTAGATTWTYTTTALAAGLHTLTARVENTSTSQQGVVSTTAVVANVLPSLAFTLSDNAGAAIGSIAAGATTDDATPTLSGTLAAPLRSGEVIKVFDGTTELTGTLTVTGTNWSFTPTASLPNATYSLSARVMSGSDVLVASAATAITVAVVTAPTQTLTMGSAATGDNVGTNTTLQGALVAGRTTDDNTPSLAGTISAPLQTGEELVIYAGTTRLGTATPSATANGAGTYDWSYTPSARPPGLTTFSARVENPSASFVGSSQPTFAVNVLPSIGFTVNDTVGIAQGVVNASAVIDDIRPTFSGTLGAPLATGEVIRIWNGTTLYGEVTPAAGATNWSFKHASLDLTSGTSNTFKVTVESGSVTATTPTANALVASSNFAFTYTAPTPALGTTTLASTATGDNVTTNSSVQGPLVSAQTTDDATPGLTGTVSGMTFDNTKGDVVALYDNGVKVSTFTTATWTYAPTTPLSAGYHNFSARVENTVSGATGAYSSEFAVNIVPSVAVQEITGDTGTNRSADLVRYVMLKKTDAGEFWLGEVQVMVDGVNVALKKTVTSAPNWGAPNFDGSQTVDGLINTGNNAGLATRAAFPEEWMQIDLGGLFNVSEIKVYETFGSNRNTEGSNARVFASSADMSGKTIAQLQADSTVKLVGTTSFTGAAGGELNTFSMSLQPDQVLDATPTITGTLGGALLPGERVVVYSGTTELGAATVTGTTWSLLVPANKALSYSTHTITAKVMPATGSNVLVGSPGYSVAVVDPATLVAPSQTPTLSFSATSDNVSSNVGGATASSITGPVLSTRTTDDQTLVLQASVGTALGANESIAIFANGTRVGTATLVSGTTYEFTTASLPAGAHSFTAQVVNSSSGLSGNASSALTANVVPTVAITAMNDGTQNLSNNGITTNKTITLTGSLAAPLLSGEVVKVSDGGTDLAGTATVGADGKTWTYVASNLTAATHSFTVKVVNAANDILVAGSAAYVADVRNSAAVTAQVQTLVSSATGDNVGTNGSVTGALVNGRTTDDSTLSIEGTLTQVLGNGEVVRIYDGTTLLGTVTPTTTSWSYTTGSLAAGLHTLQARVENTLTATVGTFSAALQANIVPSLSITVVDDYGSVTGVVSSGGSIDDTTPTLTGVLSAPLRSGEVLAVYQGSTKVGTVTPVGATWSYTPTTALTAGTLYSYSVKVEDAAGNVLVASNTSTFTVVAPEQPTQSATLTSTPNADNVATNGSITGALVSGRSTDDSTIALQGTISAALNSVEVVAILDNGVEVGTATVSGTTFTYSTNTLTDGQHSFTAVVKNTGSGLSSASPSSPFVVNVVPQAVVAEVTGDTGTNSSTTLARYVLIKKMPSSPTASLTIGEAEVMSNGVNVALGKAVTGSANWRFSDYSPELVDGNKTGWGVATRAVGNPAIGEGDWAQIDLGGYYAIDSVSLYSRFDQNNNADGSGAGVFVSKTPMWTLNTTQLLASTGVKQIGTTAFVTSAAGELNTFSVGSGIDSTVDTTPLITGFLSKALLSGERAVVFVDGVAQPGTATVAADGTWSYQVTNAMTVGTHQITLKVFAASDTGNAFPLVASVPYGLVVSSPTVAPAQTTTLTSAATGDNVSTNGSTTGLLVNGRSTDDSTLNLTGTISAALGAGEQVAVLDGSTLLGYASVSGTTWTYTTPALSTGSHSLTAVVRNTASGLSAASASAAFVAHVLPALSFTVADDQGTASAVAAGGFTDDATPTLSGSFTAALPAGELVRIYDGGVLLGNATLAADRLSWSYTPATALGLGAHTLSAKVTSSDGVTPLVVSNNVAITVTGTAAPAQTVTLASSATGDNQAGNGSVTGALVNNRTTDDNTLNLQGTLSTALGVGDVVQVLSGSTVLGNAVVDATTNTWTYTTSTLTAGLNNLTARVYNQGSAQAGSSSAVLAVNVVPEVSITNIASGGQTVSDSSVRYILVGRQVPDNLSWWRIAELEVFDQATGNNVALNKAVTASIAHPTLPLAVDGNASKEMWSEGLGSRGAFQWLQVDLGANYNVKNVNFRGGIVNAFGDSIGFTILGSKNSFADAQGVGKYDTLSTATQAASLISNALTNGENAPTLQSFTMQSKPVATLSTVSYTMSGTLSAALTGSEVVAIYDGTTYVGNATVTGATWNYNLGSVSLDNHNYTAKVQTADRNTTLVASTPVQLQVVDPSILPQQITTIASYIDRAGGVQGTFTTSGMYGDDNVPTLQGTISYALRAGERVAIYDKGVFSGYADVSGTSWTYKNSPLSAGLHSFTARVENPVITKNADFSTAFTYNYYIATINAGDNVGALQGPVDYATDDASMSLSGTLGGALLTGQKLMVFDGATSIGEATTSGTSSTNWSFNVPYNLVPGQDQTFSVRLMDADGSTVLAQAGRTVNYNPTVNSDFTAAQTYVLGNGRSLDLTQIADTNRVDRVNMSNASVSPMSVKLALSDVLAAGTDLFTSSTGWTGLSASGKHQMLIAIDGTAQATAKSLVVDSAAQAGQWTSAGTAIYTSPNGSAVVTETYNVYNHVSSNAQLILDQKLLVSGAIVL